MKLSGYEEACLVRDHVAVAHTLCLWIHHNCTVAESNSTNIILSIGHSYAFACKCVFTANDTFVESMEGNRGHIEKHIKSVGLQAAHK